MRIRLGFVSNSSSSSFLVVFPWIPKSLDELCEMMFGKGVKGTDKVKYAFDKEIEFTIDDIVKDVMWDISKGPASQEVIDDIALDSSLLECEAIRWGELPRAEIPENWDSMEESERKEIARMFIESYEAVVAKVAEREREICGISHDDISKMGYKYPKKNEETGKYGKLSKKDREHNQNIDKAWGTYYEKCAISNREFIKKFIDDNPGVAYRFTYSDNDGTMESHMEHGGIFNRLPHIMISHH